MENQGQGVVTRHQRLLIPINVRPILLTWLERFTTMESVSLLFLKDIFSGIFLSLAKAEIKDGVQKFWKNFSETFDRAINSTNGVWLSKTNQLQFLEFRPRSEHYYEQPMVVFKNNKFQDGTMEKIPFLKPLGNFYDNKCKVLRPYFLLKC